MISLGCVAGSDRKEINKKKEVALGNAVLIRKENSDPIYGEIDLVMAPMTLPQGGDKSCTDNAGNGLGEKQIEGTRVKLLLLLYKR